MKDYNFMISDDKLHKTRFCKKRGELSKTFLIKKGVGAKGGGLERFRILRGEWGGGWPKRGGGDFFKDAFIPWCPLCITTAPWISSKMGKWDKIFAIMKI